MKKSVWKSILPKAKTAHELRKMLYAWKEQADKLPSEEISKDKYDEWRYHYPEFDTTQIWAKVPSQALSDALVYCSKTSSNQINKDDKKPLAMSFYPQLRAF